MNRYIKQVISVAVVAVFAFVFYNKVYIPKTTFKTISPSEGSLLVTTKGIGNVSAKNIYTITAQTGGKILQLKSDVGMWVKKGDLLVVMDGVDLPAQLEVAQASYEKSQYDIKASKDELTNQKAQKVLLESTYKRYEKLKARKFVTQSEYDKAKADLDSIKAGINATKAHIGSAKALAKIALKNIEVIQEKIARLKVYAPVDGYVIAKSAEVAQNVLPSSAILKIVDATTLWVRTKIDERISASVKVGQKATIRLRSQPNKIYEGIVARVEAMSDAVTLEREIDVAFVNIPKPFYINEQAEVKVSVTTYENLVKIPSSMVVQNGGDLGVWIVDASRAKFVKLEIVAQNEKEVGVKNLTKDIKIIVPDAKKKPLQDGMKIHL